MAEAYRVVIVEDDADVAFYTKTVLEKRAGCVAITVADPFLARAAIAEFAPDVVVTDIEMPGMTGLELIQQIRADRPELPIIVMTAHISVDYAVGALQAQADEFLLKPIGASDLVTAVTRLASEGRLTQATDRPRRHILAIGAYPDDVEIGVGGILAGHRADGDTVTILTLARTRSDDEITDSQHESLASAELLGARLFLEDLQGSDILAGDAAVGIIERVVREINPTTVYTHSPHDSDPVHRAVFEAASTAARTVSGFASFQSPSSTIDFRPSKFVSIDGHTDAKLALLACFSSQASHRDYLDSEAVLANARYWARYGEGATVEPLEVVREAADESTSGLAATDAARP
jgi:DNA-binding response OmpR family regulator